MQNREKVLITLLIIYIGILLGTMNLLVNKIDKINKRVQKLEVNYSIYEYDINQLKEYRGR